ncbi:hypothetical protein F4861DRAFT_160197 [Xylaria intraflava]|nr:hypothetical protein F4861DRAFT_160197 [Xylaria intraflava]
MTTSSLSTELVRWLAYCLAYLHTSVLRILYSGGHIKRKHASRPLPSCPHLRSDIMISVILGSFGRQPSLSAASLESLVACSPTPKSCCCTQDLPRGSGQTIYADFDTRLVRPETSPKIEHWHSGRTSIGFLRNDTVIVIAVARLRSNPHLAFSSRVVHLHTRMPSWIRLRGIQCEKGVTRPAHKTPRSPKVLHSSNPANLQPVYLH